MRGDYENRKYSDNDILDILLYSQEKSVKSRIKLNITSLVKTYDFIDGMDTVAIFSNFD